MNEYIELMNAAIAFIGAVSGIIIMILKTRGDKNKEFVKLLELLNSGQPIQEALSQVAVTMDEVTKKANSVKVPQKLKKLKEKVQRYNR